MSSSRAVLGHSARAGGGPARHRRPARLTWPRLLERLLGGYAPTLWRAALLMVVLVAGLVCVGAVWGVAGIAVATGLCAMQLLCLVSRLTSPLAG